MGNDRDEKGRFVKGHKGGPGRPRRSIEERFLKAFSDGLKIGDIKQMREVIMVRALCGDVKSARFIMDYAVGKPMQYVSADINSANEVVINVICHEGNLQCQPPAAAPKASGDQE